MIKTRFNLEMLSAQLVMLRIDDLDMLTEDEVSRDK